MKRFLPFAVLMVAAACSDGAAPFAPTAESESVLLASRSAAANAGKAGKVGVCHVDDKGNYKLINVSANAWKAHEAHGDIVPDGNGVCSEVTFEFVGPLTQKNGVISWTVDGTPRAVTFLVQLQLPSDPTSPAPGWVTQEEITGTVPGGPYYSNIWGNGTFKIVATFAVGSPVESLPITF